VSTAAGAAGAVAVDDATACVMRSHHLNGIHHDARALVWVPNADDHVEEIRR
jgi:hypothetical protein